MTLADSRRSISTSAPALLIVLAWVVTLLVSTLPDALWAELIGAAPSWLFWAKAGLVLVLIVLAWAWNSIRPLRPYLILLFTYLLAWRLLAWVRVTPSWARWESQGSWVVGMFGIQVLKIGVALITIAVLLLVMRRRQDAFLARGQWDARAQPVRWIGLKGDDSWKVVGPIVAFAGAAIMLAFLALTNRPSAATVVRALPLLPAVLLLSALNAVNEEVSYRSGLLAPVYQVIGKGQAMALTAVFFGLAHYGGSGLLAELPNMGMIAFLGWWMGKSMIETRGFVWAWFIHFVNDIPVFAFLAIGSIF